MKQMDSCVIKMYSGLYVKNTSDDVEDIKEAKVFKSKKAATSFAYHYCGREYDLVEIESEKVLQYVR